MNPSVNQQQPAAPGPEPQFAAGGMPGQSQGQGQVPAMPPVQQPMPSVPQPQANPNPAATAINPEYQYQHFQPTTPATPQPQANLGQAPVVGNVAPPPGTKPAVKPVAHTNPNSTQNMLQVAEVRDGIVIMSDGSFRSVIMVKSINFDLMSQQEQEAVEYSYQNFLNSLYFPIQIFIRSQKVDLQPYVEKLDKIRSEHDNMLLALLMEDYINYITMLSQQTNIMDKKFYVVIPYFPRVDVQKALSQSKNFLTGLADMFSTKEKHVVVNEADLETAKNELRNRVQAVLSGLMQCSIQGLPLDTQELIELYYDTYNPDTATRQELKNFDDLNADVITKGQGMAVQSHLQRELE